MYEPKGRDKAQKDEQKIYEILEELYQDYYKTNMETHKKFIEKRTKKLLEYDVEVYEVKAFSKYWVENSDYFFKVSQFKKWLNGYRAYTSQPVATERCPNSLCEGGGWIVFLKENGHEACSPCLCTDTPGFRSVVPIGTVGYKELEDRWALNNKRFSVPEWWRRKIECLDIPRESNSETSERREIIRS